MRYITIILYIYNVYSLLRLHRKARQSLEQMTLVSVGDHVPYIRTYACRGRYICHSAPVSKVSHGHNPANFKKVNAWNKLIASLLITRSIQIGMKNEIITLSKEIGK